MNTLNWWNIPKLFVENDEEEKKLLEMLGDIVYSNDDFVNRMKNADLDPIYVSEKLAQYLKNGKYKKVGEKLIKMK